MALIHDPVQQWLGLWDRKYVTFQVSPARQSHNTLKCLEIHLDCL